MSLSPRLQGWLPLLLMATLIVALGGVHRDPEDAFLSSYNLNNLLLATMPLALVSLGQATALLVGGFDVSVAALMTFCVVVASYTMTPETSGWALGPGGARPRRRGAGDRDLQRGDHPRLPPSVDHRHARDVQHPRGRVAPAPRPPRGPDLRPTSPTRLTTSVGFVPIAFVGVVVLAVLADVWLYRTRGGLALRAVGLDETSSRRLGMGTGRTVFLAFVVCSVMASIAGFFLAAQVQIGSPIIGNFGAREHRRGRPRRREPRGRTRARTSGRCWRRSSSR